MTYCFTKQKAIRNFDKHKVNIGQFEYYANPSLGVIAENLLACMYGT
jgi:hypothetical protein